LIRKRVDVDRPAGAHLLVFALLKDSQELRLQRQGKVADFARSGSSLLLIIWFVRETATVPISLLPTADVTEVINDDLLGKTLGVPNPYELLGRRSHVSLPLKSPSRQTVLSFGKVPVARLHSWPH
jgi:hypothetical protein